MKPRARPPRNSNAFEPRVTFGAATDSSVNGELIVKSTPIFKLVEMLSNQEVVPGKSISPPSPTLPKRYLEKAPAGRRFNGNTHLARPRKNGPRLSW